MISLKVSPDPVPEAPAFKREVDAWSSLLA